MDDAITSRLHMTVASVEDSMLRLKFVGVDGPGLSGVATVLGGGIALWGILFTVVLNSPLSEKLSTKHYNGPFAARVETTDRCLAFLHAAISGCFGVYAFVAAAPGLCSYDPRVEAVMRFGVAMTASFLIYDFALLIVAEVVMGLRETSWGMWIHHLNIIPFFILGLYHNQVTWFMCANLINEVSTLPLHATFFMHVHGMSGSPLFYVCGVMLVLTFLILRVVAIGVIGYLYGAAGGCESEGAPRTLVVVGWVTLIVHWILNAYWYMKIMRMVLFKKDKPRESVPLIATEAGLGPTPPEESASATS